MLDKAIEVLQGEARQYSKNALSNPVDKTEFEYGVHHGVLKGLSLAEQRLRELLEEEEDVENE